MGEPLGYQYPLFTKDRDGYKYYYEKDLKAKRLYETNWDRTVTPEYPRKKVPSKPAKTEKPVNEETRETVTDERKNLVAELTILLREHCSGLLEASNAAVALANLYYMQKKGSS